MNRPRHHRNAASRRTLTPLLLMVLLAGSSGCGEVAFSGSSPESPAVPVSPTAETAQTAVVEYRPWPRTLRVQGTLMGDDQTVVGAKVAGRVDQVLVDLGSVVRRGDPLVLLEREEFDLAVQFAEAQLQQACAAIGLKSADSLETLDRQKAPPVALELAQLDQARVDAERARSLARNQAITAEELRQRETAEEVAQARYLSALNAVEERIAQVRVRRSELAQARQRRDEATIPAPFDGQVLSRHVAPGSFVQSGASVVTLVRTDPLRFTCGVPERQVVHVRLDQQVLIHVEGEAQPRLSRIARLSPAVDVSSRSLVIEADVPNPDGRLRTGLFAEAEIVTDPDAKSLAVPTSAVTEFAGVQKVLVAGEGEPKEQRIETGRKQDGWVEVLGGLKPGDVVITNRSSAQDDTVGIVPDGAS